MQHVTHKSGFFIADILNESKGGGVKQKSRLLPLVTPNDSSYWVRNFLLDRSNQSPVNGDTVLNLSRKSHPFQFDLSVQRTSSSSSPSDDPISPWPDFDDGRLRVSCGETSISIESSTAAVKQLRSWSSRPSKPIDLALPAWIFCTRYSDRPSSGPRMRKLRQKNLNSKNCKRPRTSFTATQINRLIREFEKSKYLSELRRRQLARELDLKESQVKIWFQNKRAKTKKAAGACNSLALYLMAEGLYNHSVRVEKAVAEE